MRNRFSEMSFSRIWHVSAQKTCFPQGGNHVPTWNYVSRGRWWGCWTQTEICFFPCWVCSQANGNPYGLLPSGVLLEKLWGHQDCNSDRNKRLPFPQTKNQPTQLERWTQTAKGASWPGDQPGRWCRDDGSTWSQCISLSAYHHHHPCFHRPHHSPKFVRFGALIDSLFAYLFACVHVRWPASGFDLQHGWMLLLTKTTRRTTL